MMRLSSAVILGMMLLPGSSFAQTDNVTMATSALGSVLVNLKQSVSKLSVQNDQLASKDDAIKQQIAQLQAQLGQAQAQGDVLNKAADKLQENNPRRAKQVAELEQENFDLDNRIQKAQVSIKAIEQALGAGYVEDQKLLLQLKSMQKIPSSGVPVFVQSSGSQAEARRQKEKLKLMKMIYDSQQRQEALHGAMLDVRKNAPVIPGATALAHQQLLKEQIKELQSQIAAYPSESFSANPGAGSQWDDDQLRQLGAELKVLEQNYAQLKGLMEQMTNKAQSNKTTTVAQKVESEKLQGSMEDLNHQGEALRADLDDLRSQMVDLDKRKSHLEVMIQQLP